MKVTRDSSSPIELKLTVEMAAEDENPYLERSYRRTVGRVNVPGFRRGKAPRRVVERIVGRSALLQEALDYMVPETLDRVLRDESVRAFGEPSIEVTDLDPVAFTATVPLEPTVELGDYRSIRVTADAEEVGDEQVDAMLENIRQEQALWEPVERPAQYGDRLNLNVKGVIGEETVVDDADVEYVPEAENVLPFPGFAPHLLGLSEDDESEFTMTVPADYPREQYAGKEVAFWVEVLSVKEKTLPDLDDELAKSVGEGYDDLATLRATLTQNMNARAAAEARSRLEQQSLEALCDAAVVNASPLLYARELEAVVAERERMLRQQGIDLPTYLRYIGRTPEQFQEEMRPGAERRLVGGLVLRKLAEAEEIEVSDDDVQSEVDRMLKSSFNDEEAEADVELVSGDEGDFEVVVDADGDGDDEVDADADDDADESDDAEAEAERLENLRAFLRMDSTRDNIRSNLHNRRVMDRLLDITQGRLESDGVGDGGDADVADAVVADVADAVATDSADAAATDESPVSAGESESADTPVVASESESGDAPAIVGESESGDAPVSAGESESGDAPVVASEGESGDAPAIAGESESADTPVVASEGESGDVAVVASEGESGDVPVIAGEGESGDAPVSAGESESGDASAIANESESESADALTPEPASDVTDGAVAGESDTADENGRA